MKLKQILSGIGVIALAGIGVFSAAQLPAPAQLTKPSQPLAPIGASGGSLNLVCTGNVQSLVVASTSAQAAQTNNSQNIQITQAASGLALSDSSLLRSDTSKTEDAQKQENSAGITWQNALTTPADESTPDSSDTSSTGESGTPIPITDAKRAILFANSAKDSRGILSLAREQSEVDRLAGANTHYATSGDLRGLATNPCTWATRSAWFVGLEAGVGSANQLRILNPSANPLVVELSAFNSQGPAQVGANAHIAIAPGQIKQITLDGILNSDERIALHLQSATGLFAASVESTALEGLTPRGIDFIKPSESGTSLVIPGLYFPPHESSITQNGAPLVELDENIPEQVPRAENTPSDTAAKAFAQTQSIQSTENTSKLVETGFSAFVRIANPSENTRTVSVYTIHEGDRRSILPGGAEIPIAPGTVFDLSLDGLHSGSYAVQLVSDGEISAGVQISSASESEGTDYAWLAAQNPLTTGMAVVAPGTAQLLVTDLNAQVNPSSSDAGATNQNEFTWTAYDKNGKRLDRASVALPLEDADESDESTASSSETNFGAGVTRSITLPENTRFVEISANNPVYAAVSTTMTQGQARLVDWTPLTAGIGEVAKVSINLRN